MNIFKMQGVALIQVLIMTAIMSLIAIQFTQTARQQVDTAQGFKNRIQAELLLKTAKSRLLFSFFTHDSIDLSDQVINGVKWNFKGQAFQISPGVFVKIQAISGLLSVITAPDSYWHKTLLYLGASTDQADVILASLRDWIDVDNNTRIGGAERAQYANTPVFGPRNGPLQHISELQYIKGISPSLYQKLKPLVTIYPTSSFDPALAPAPLVRALYSSDIAAQILNAQKSDHFTEQVWQSIVGSQVDDYIVFHPRSTFLVSIKVKSGEVILKDHFDLNVSAQQANDPLVILQNY